jgi:small subunit ribosomal protein S9
MADHIAATGRRKEAVARVWLNPGAGLITVNGKPINEYFQGSVKQKAYQRPFEITKTMGKYSGSVKVIGGGAAGQLDAVIHGISRALANFNVEEFRSPLKVAKLLTRDARVKERRKYGLAQKARAKKSSPKR